MLKQLISFRLLVLVLVVAFLTSCGKDDDGNAPGGSKDCQLIKVKSDTDETEFIYDGNNRITRANSKENNQIVSYQTFEYNGSNQLTKSTEFSMNGTTAEQDYYTTYEYNANGLRSKETNFYADFSGGPFVANDYITYEYNAAKQITTARTFERDGNSFTQIDYTNFTYDGKANITKASSFDMDEVLLYEVATEYDDKPNVIKNIAGAITAFDLVSIPVYFSANNFTKLTASLPDEADDDADGNTTELLPFATISNTYTLNADNMISSITMDFSLGFFSDKVTANLEYNCK